jgi:hypothetical protein
VSIGGPYPQAFTAVHGDRFYYADAERFEVRVYGADGTLERLIRVAADPPRYRRDEIFPTIPAARDTDDPAAFGFPISCRTSATWLSMKTAVSGCASTAPSTSTAQCRDGSSSTPMAGCTGRCDCHWAWCGTLYPRMSAARQQARQDLQIGEDFMLTSVRDEYGVESVVLYPLEKHGPGR